MSDVWRPPGRDEEGKEKDDEVDEEVGVVGVVDGCGCIVGKKKEKLGEARRKMCSRQLNRKKK